jgi:hypothetical protein
MSDDLTPELTPERGTPDVPTPPATGAPPDRAGDPELAAVLAVAPLDDLTRRRLVRTALAERPRATRPVGRLVASLGVAAALVIGVLIGTLVVTRPDDPDPTTAAGAPASSPSPSAPSDAEAPALVPAPATPLGDLGAVDSASALREAITARLEAGRDRAATSPGAVVSADACAARGPGAAGLVVIGASGTATLDAAPAVVLVGPTPSGENVAIVLDAASCTVLETVPLQG